MVAIKSLIGLYLGSLATVYAARAPLANKKTVTVTAVEDTGVANTSDPMTSTATPYTSTYEPSYNLSKAAPADRAQYCVMNQATCTISCNNQVKLNTCNNQTMEWACECDTGVNMVSLKMNKIIK